MGETAAQLSPYLFLELKNEGLQFIELEGEFFEIPHLELPMPRVLLISILFCLTISLLFSGCYNKSIRHLASDASLIKAGTSSRNDVLTYLGEPDALRILEDGREEWVYIEEQPSDLQRAPVVGGFFEGKGYDKVLVVLENDIVQSCQFREFANDEFDWDDESFWKIW